MKIELLHNSPLSIVIKAIRKCYESEGNSDSHANYDGNESKYHLGEKDAKLIRQIISSGHHSTIEHAVYTFDIDGVSRGLLQELARHRIASPSVKSTRYTLGRIKSESPFGGLHLDKDHIEKYLVYTGDVDVDMASAAALENVRRLAVEGKPNDKLKYCLPESFKTFLVFTINARSLRNLLTLRTSSRALWEIQLMARKMFDLIPESHKILFEGAISE